MTFRRDNINIRGFGAPTLALALRLPADYGPWGRWGINQHGELAVMEQAQRAEQPTADRDLISLYARSAARNGREFLTRALLRGGKNLAVELAQVEFGGARQCPGGRNKSE